METKKIYKFIILMGFVSLFGDTVYEGTKGIAGPYLYSLGASLFIVSFTAGLGEFLGYALRFISGYFSDKYKTYWIFTFIGYGLIASIPLLALVDRWDIAVLFILLERIGKGIRSSARDAIISFATSNIGRGLGFGIHEAFDRLGSIIGPLIFLASFGLSGSYKTGFLVMLIPFILLMMCLILAYKILPNPSVMEKPQDKPYDSKILYMYMLFSFFAIISFPQYPVISYHLKMHNIFSEQIIVLLYTVTMVFDLIFSLLVGKFYDKWKFKVLLLVPIATFVLPIFAFQDSKFLAVLGIVLYGFIMAFHQSVMRAAIADLTSISKRGTVYGLFNLIFGVGYLLGGIFIGYLYNFGYFYIMIFALFSQILSMYFLIKLNHKY